MTMAKFTAEPGVRQFQLQISGDDAFSVVEFTLHEEMNEIGALELKLASPKRSVDPEEVIGGAADFTFLCGTQEDPFHRYYHGVVQRFELIATDRAVSYYRARVVPRFWRLGLKRQCRVHVTDPSEGKGLQEVLARVLEEGGLTGEAVDFRILPTKPYSFLAQYQESDLDFVRRLCETEGVSFFFEHTHREDVLVFADRNSVLLDAEPFHEVLFREADTALTDETETIHSLELSSQMHHAVVEYRDYDFHNSRKAIIGSSDGEEREREYYDYPGKFMEPEDPSERMRKLSNLRREEFAAASIVGVGASDCRSLSAGRMFRVRYEDQPLLDRRWLCLAATHHGTQEDLVDAEGAPIGLGGISYSNVFRCLPDDVMVRPPRKTRQPVVAGSQTAVVVGPEGEEIHTDEHGRIKVQLLWDRERSFGEDSSFWVRVNQHWAGRHWGMFFLPRIGQEVIVDFLEGDPDRPIVTGAVYNDFQRTPYLLPEHKTRSTVKSNSTLGGEGFNEIRFEDKKGKEQIFVHAQRNVDLQVKQDMMERIGNDRHVVIGWKKDGETGGNLNEKVFGEHHRIVKSDCNEQIEGDQWIVYGDGDDPDGGHLEIVVEKDKKELVGGDSHLTVDGEQRIHCGKDFYHTVEGEYHLKVGKSLHITAEEIYLSGNAVSIWGDSKVAMVQGSSGEDMPTNVMHVGRGGVSLHGNLVEINGAYGWVGRVDANPLPAVEPEIVSKPNEPTLAADDRTGEKSVRTVNAGASARSKESSAPASNPITSQAGEGSSGDGSQGSFA